MSNLAQFVHRRILLLLLLSYGLAAVAPQAGVALRELRWDLQGFGEFSVPQLMLALLLFISAMGAKPALLAASWKSPVALLAALGAKIVAAPLAVLGLTAIVWAAGLAEQLAPLLLGLALVAAMPLASSAPAWTQAANGNIATSLGVLATSLVACPLVGSLWIPRLATALRSEFALSVSPWQAAGYFLTWVVAPSLAGVAVRARLRDEAYARMRPTIKVIGAVLLLSLIYAFASAALVDLSQLSDLTLVAWSFALAGSLSAGLFALGWAGGRALQLDGDQRIAVTYAVGMHNNGVAMLIGAEFLAPDSPVFLPMISYALAQHLLAALVDSAYQRRLANVAAD